MRAAIVYNPVKVDLDELRAAVAAEQPAEWDDALWLETAEDDAGEQAAKDAVAAGVDLVIAAGGDGTIRVAAAAVAETSAAFAVLPAGTGNLLARNLGLDITSVTRAIHTAFHGTDRTIDLATLELERESGEREHFDFAVIAGFGLDAEMIANTDDDLKKKAGWLAYIDAGARAFASLERVRVRYRLDGHRSHRGSNANTFIVGNCGALQGDVVVLPDAVVDDGLLDIAIVRPKGFVGWARVVGHIIVNSGAVSKVLPKRSTLGKRTAGSAVGHGQTTGVDVRLDEPRRVQVDGDAVGEAVAMRFTVRPGVLRVRVIG